MFTLWSLNPEPWTLDSRLSTLLMHCTKNLKQIFPEMKLRGLVPNFYIRKYVSAFIYSNDRSANVVQQNRRTHRSWEYINPSQIHECRNWERGSFISGNIGFEFSVQCRAFDYERWTWNLAFLLKRLNILNKALCAFCTLHFCVYTERRGLESRL